MLRRGLLVLLLLLLLVLLLRPGLRQQLLVHGGQAGLWTSAWLLWMLLLLLLLRLGMCGVRRWHASWPCRGVM